MGKLGVIGGSGIYDFPGLDKVRAETVETPWGEPSDALLFGELDGTELVFLPRHGRGHVLSPTELNYRANIDAMKRAGVSDIVSISACGSFREALSPGTFVLVDQYIDRTVAREKSFFGKGCVAHVSMADPVCGRLNDALAKAAEAQNIAFQRGGTYLAMEGPQFSSRAESALHRSWGCDVIGMTAMPEAKLAREAEICYATVAMVTDYDCWHDAHGDVNVESVLEVLSSNGQKVTGLIAELAKGFAHPGEGCVKGCDKALDRALVTTPAARDPVLVGKLDAVAGRVLNA